MSYDVRCPSCRGIFHETTENFSFDKPADGTMFRMKHPYGPSGYNWTTFPYDDSAMGADLVCPWCETCYVDEKGKIIHLLEQRKRSIGGVEEKEKEKGNKGQKGKKKRT